jgi:apolipoprotein D and lipocalin family protein
MTDPQTVEHVDLARYLGTWYEICRLPLRHERATYGDITAHYSMNPDGSLRIANRAFDETGALHESEGRGDVVEGSGNARLEVTFLPEGLRWLPFGHGDYWILRLDPGYRTALVGTPTRRYLWLLHREPRVEAAVREDFLGTARARGFKLEGLIDTPQTG